MSATKISWISAEGYYWTIFIFWHSTKCTTYERKKSICRGEFQKCISIQTCITLVIYSQIYRNHITMCTIKWQNENSKYPLKSSIEDRIPKFGANTNLTLSCLRFARSVRQIFSTYDNISSLKGWYRYECRNNHNCALIKLDNLL